MTRAIFAVTALVIGMVGPLAGQQAARDDSSRRIGSFQSTAFALSRVAAPVPAPSAYVPSPDPDERKFRMVIGGMVGGAIGTYIGFRVGERADRTNPDPLAVDQPKYTIVGAIIGVLAGVLVGSVVP